MDLLRRFALGEIDAFETLVRHYAAVAVILQLHPPTRPVTDRPFGQYPLTFGQLDVGNSLSVVESVYA